jgi:hypothetical protein
MNDPLKGFAVVPGPTSSATPTHPHVVDRVVDPVHLVNVSAERYALRKALLQHDEDGIKKAAGRLSREDQLAVCGEVDEIRKSADIAKGEWCREHHRYDGPHEQPQPKFTRPIPIAGDGTSRLVKLEQGQIIHWTTSDGELIHGKVKTFGPKGARVIAADGDEWNVKLADIRPGVHASAQAEYQVLSAKRDERERRRVWNLATEVGLHALTPEQRAEYFKMRENPE